MPVSIFSHAPSKEYSLPPPAPNWALYCRFLAPRRKIIIELDGVPHLDQKEYDLVIATYLDDLGYQILRFWNHEVLADIDRVVETIRVKAVNNFSQTHDQN